MSNPCMILEASDADQWAPFHGCRRIEAGNRPTVLHPSREIAEAEALRLAQAHPGRLFVVFEAATAGRSLKVPTHITLGGTVVAERWMPGLVQIGEDDVPF